VDPQNQGTENKEEAKMEVGDNKEEAVNGETKAEEKKDQVRSFTFLFSRTPVRCYCPFPLVQCFKVRPA
jgi:hypothetical protein